MKLYYAFLGLLVTALMAGAAAIPAGTELHVRLTAEASSEQPAGAAIAAVVLTPVFDGEVLKIAPGTIVSGTTADVRQFVAAGGKQANTEAAATEQAATLRLRFTEIKAASGGRARPLPAVVEVVDNARETVDSSGLITGIAASQTMEAQIDRGLNKLASRNQQFADIISGLKSALVKQVNASIDYKPGVELTLRLTKALDWEEKATLRMPAEIRPAEAAEALVAAQPIRTVAQNPPKPSDLTNVILIGSAEDIQEAFHAAGWFAARALSATSRMETARALIEDRGYGEAPMSILLLDGRPPDFALQKQNDTFAMRHHIRIWRGRDTFEGKPVWIGAGTHDIRITLSAASRSFTHGIDSNIDLERAKIVSDLLFTGAVRQLALVERTGIPKDVSNATGDALVTDGKIAVLVF